MRAAAEAAVAAGDDVLASHALRVTGDALRHDLRMLDDVGGVRHYAGHQYLSLRQLDAVPNGVLMLMARIRAFDQISLRPDAQHEIDYVLQLDVVRVRPMP